MQNPKTSLIFLPSLWSLLVSNLLTILIALTQNWSPATIIWTYWCQSVIIGFFVFLRIISLRSFSTEGMTENGKPIPENTRGKWGSGVFFLFHYGFFHLGYAVFLSGLFSGVEWRYVAAGAGIFFVNHLISFFQHRAGELKQKPHLGTLMMRPYARIIPMHLIIIFFSGIIQTQTGLIAFLFLKTIADVLMHGVIHAPSSEVSNSYVSDKTGLQKKKDE